MIGKTISHYKSLETKTELSVWGMAKLGVLYLLQGKIEKAKDQNWKLVEATGKYGETYWAARSRYVYAYLHYKSGHFPEA